MVLVLRPAASFSVHSSPQANCMASASMQAFGFSEVTRQSRNHKQTVVTIGVTWLRWKSSMPMLSESNYTFTYDSLNQMLFRTLKY